MPALESDLLLEVGRTLDKCQPPLLSQVSVHCADRPAKDAVDGSAQRRGFSIHRATATDYQIGKPDQIQTIDRTFGNNHASRRNQVGPFIAQRLILSVAARECDDCYVRPVEELECFCKQDVAFVIVVVRLSRWRAQGNNQVFRGNAQLLANGWVGAEAGNVDIFLQAGVFQYPTRPPAHGTVRYYLRSEDPVG